MASAPQSSPPDPRIIIPLSLSFFFFFFFSSLLLLPPLTTCFIRPASMRVKACTSECCRSSTPRTTAWYTIRSNPSLLPAAVDAALPLLLLEAAAAAFSPPSAGMRGARACTIRDVARYKVRRTASCCSAAAGALVSAYKQAWATLSNTWTSRLLLLLLLLLLLAVLLVPAFTAPRTLSTNASRCSCDDPARDLAKPSLATSARSPSAPLPPSSSLALGTGMACVWGVCDDDDDEES